MKYESGQVRKWTTVRTERYAGNMQHFHVWTLEQLGTRTALVMLEPAFPYRNGAVRAAPPGSRFRVFKCQNHCGR